jgi:hypothetical protein
MPAADASLFAKETPVSDTAWSEIERAIAAEPSKLSPQMQQYLHEQVLAILASHQETTPSAQRLPLQQSPPSNPPPANVVQHVLPGPHPDGAPVIDEDTYRRASLPRVSVEASEKRTLHPTPEVTPVAYIEADSKNTDSAGPINTTSKTTAGASAALDKESTVDVSKLGSWRTSLNDALNSLEAEMKNLPEKDREASTFAVYVRLLHTIANHHEEAIAEIEQLPAEEQEYWKHQLYAILLAIDADQKHTSSRRAALVLRELRAAVDRLANVSTLDVRHLALCKSVDSYGCFTEFPTLAFRPGDEVVLYVEVDNFTAEKVQDKYETELLWTYDILDSKGNRMANVVLPLDKNRCENRRRDYFIAPKVFLPKDLRPDKYTLRVSVEDVKGGKSNEGSIEFRIK